MPLFNQPVFEVDLRSKTCFPANMDTSKLKEITPVGATWAQFINIETGEVVDCGEYAKAAFADPSKENQNEDQT
jgi:hypothetical protein